MNNNVIDIHCGWKLAFPLGERKTLFRREESNFVGMNSFSYLIIGKITTAIVRVGKPKTRAMQCTSILIPRIRYGGFLNLYFLYKYIYTYFMFDRLYLRK